MTWEEMFMAIKALDSQASLMMRNPGDWYVSASIEVKDGLVLVSAYGNGETPELAVRDQWSKLTDDIPGQYVVINAAGPRRRAYDWVGYMWREVDENLKGAATSAGRQS
jgi:hypothetical protein